MGRWSHLDSDAERLPEGMRRVAYDADTQTYSYRDNKGHLYEGAPGNQYGTLSRVRSAQETAPLPSFFSDGYRRRRSVPAPAQLSPKVEAEVERFLSTGKPTDYSREGQKEKDRAQNTLLARSRSVKDRWVEKIHDTFDERRQSFRDPEPQPRFSMGKRSKTSPMDTSAGTTKPAQESDKFRTSDDLLESDDSEAEVDEKPLENPLEGNKAPKRSHTERAPPSIPRKPVAEYRNSKKEKGAKRMSVSPLALIQLALKKPPASPKPGRARREGPRLPPELLQRRGTV